MQGLNEEKEIGGDGPADERREDVVSLRHCSRRVSRVKSSPVSPQHQGRLASAHRHHHHHHHHQSVKPALVEAKIISAAINVGTWDGSASMTPSCLRTIPSSVFSISSSRESTRTRVNDRPTDLPPPDLFSEQYFRFGRPLAPVHPPAAAWPSRSQARRGLTIERRFLEHS